METQAQEGFYIYCIIGAAAPSPAAPDGAGRPRTFGPHGIGGRGDEVYCVCADGLAAVVSRTPLQKFRMSRDNLLAHERVIEEVMKTDNVLPVRFATVAESEEKVGRILKKEEERFSVILREMEGRKEMGLKAFFKSEEIYPHITARYSNIRQMRERLKAMPDDKIYFQKMEVGRLVEDALKNEREKCRAEILGILSPLALDFKSAVPYGELMILNASFLVERRREPEFDEALRKLDDRLGALVTWHYAGTLPPFNFVNVVINAEDL